VSDNIFNFTAKLKEKRKETVQEIYDTYVEETEVIVEDWINHLLDELIEAEVADDSIEFSRDFVFASEAVRSMIYRSRGDVHMFQDIADKMLDVEWFDDDRIQATWKINPDELDLPEGVELPPADVDLPSAVDDAANVMMMSAHKGDKDES
jgi:hypothetical protein|tara:strand:+ start:731 stop:1183 length:453 start_codon:yes stop_codon:yes gene_type:complete